ncbi:hypothetical protein BA896_022710 [Janthinobacterium lividum]|uniref:Uncharacterized protein n=1 Tax=Janthinobacterium lividum TaxID=29581 RepID=A0A1E8PJ57_9BURK|nr:hypothetical protein BA896_022710 [Janthinobacterium lividum]
MALAFFALATVGLMEAKAATDYNWTQVSRWREGVRYNQDGATIYPQEWYPAKGYDVRPHKQLYKMFPSWSSEMAITRPPATTCGRPCSTLPM